jgi:hypothetical protein
LSGHSRERSGRLISSNGRARSGRNWRRHSTVVVPGRIFGLDAEGNPQAPYLARLFGVRDVALGWGILNSEGDTRRQWLLAGLACDIADAFAGLAGGRRAYLPKVTSGLVTGTALSAAALGGAALNEK